MAVTTTPLTDTGHPQDPVSIYEKHRNDLQRAKMGQNILFLLLFLGMLAFSVITSQFYPERLAQAASRVFEYFGTIMPNLQWDLLFEGRDEQGRAVEGSLTFWYTDIGTYLELIWETILMAITATLLGTAGALALCFAGSRNLMKNSWIYFFARRFMEICRGVPEILIALVFVFAFGIGPLAGILAVAIHSAGGARQAVRRGERERLAAGPSTAFAAWVATGSSRCATACCRRCCRTSSPMACCASRSMCAPPRSSALSVPAASDRNSTASSPSTPMIACSPCSFWW